jgi:hypothetical protein
MKIIKYIYLIEVYIKMVYFMLRLSVMFTYSGIIIGSEETNGVSVKLNRFQQSYE